LPPPTPSPTHHRWALLAGALLCLAAALPLLLLPGQTGRYFAFQLGSPLGAAFLGGCFLAGCAALGVAWWERSWGGSVVIGPGVFSASSLSLAVTLIELDRLQLGGPEPVARLLAWAWLAAGVLAPLGWLYLVLSNDRRWTFDPRARPHLPAPLLTLVVVQSFLLFAAGGWLFVAPESAPWPWRLQGPADRLIGGWLVAFALTGFAVLVERDEGRNRPAFAACLVLALVLLGASLLDRHEIHLSWVGLAYWAFLGSLLVTAFAGLRRGVRDRRPRAAPFVR